MVTAPATALTPRQPEQIKNHFVLIEEKNNNIVLWLRWITKNAHENTHKYYKRLFVLNTGGVRQSQRRE